MKTREEGLEGALEWIRKYTVDGKGITVTSKEPVIYPEVTGYYIPTLLQWGEADLAKSYAAYLCSTQGKDGAWYDFEGRTPYVFDTGQILKGLVAVYPSMPEVKDHILAGCDWLLSRVNEQGRLEPAAKDTFPAEETFYSELIHTYCLTPLMDAAALFQREEYRQTALRIKEYYVKEYREKILHFSLLSHFYAYVMEGLLDMGEEALIREAMENLEGYQNPQGGIPGLCDVKWVCSTGMFQIALVWYKLGELEKGNRIFDYAAKLQNPSGGFFGSYPASFFNRFSRGHQKAHYFPDAEISWANKYFLDAIWLRRQLEAERTEPT
jgi:malonyl-CoA O-methyltransferase